MNLAHGIYFDGQTARGRAVTIEFTDDLAHVRGEDLALDLELARLRVSDRLGEVPRFLYLPENALIETADNAIVDAALARRRRSRGARLIHALESQQRIAAVACVLLLASIAALAFYGPPVLARVVAQRVPDDVDRRVGAIALAGLQRYVLPSNLSPHERERVRVQLDRIRGAAPANAPRIQLQFYSMGGRFPNAFALPGNTIIVTDELVRLLPSDDELAAVLAHELGHLEHRHGLQSLLRQSSALLIVAAVTGDLMTLTSFAASLPLTILTAGYSRDLEREADRFALERLRARGIAPRVFSSVLARLDLAHRDLPRGSPYLSTHPASEERSAMFGVLTAAERNSLLAAPWFELALSASRRGQHAEVIAHVGKFLEFDTTARAHLLRAQSHQALGDAAAFEQDIAKALQLDPKCAEAFFAHAEFLARQARKFPAAVAAAEAGLAIEPDHVAGLATLGYAETMRGNLAAAGTHLDRALKLTLTNPRVWGYRGFLKTHQRDFPGAIADYNRALGFAPKEPWILRLRGHARVQLREFNDALADFAAVTDPNQQDAEYFAQRGMASHGLGRFDRAIADYSEAIKKAEPGFSLPEVFLNRGSARLASGDPPAAIVDLTAALKNAPHPEAHYLRAIAYDRSGETAKAFADLEQALAAGKDELAVIRQRGITQGRAGHLEAALRDLDLVLSRQADAFTLRARGLIYFVRRDYARAEVDFSAAIAQGKASEPEYSEFFRILVRRHQGGADRVAEFSATVAQWPDGWPKSVGRYLAGELTETQLLNATYAGPLPTLKERLCEAYFYIGETHLLAGNRSTAEINFQSCITTGISHFSEHLLARAELARLGDRR